MKKFWEQLKPQERRWVIAIGCLVFIVLNYFFVWPKFGEWRKNSARIKNANERMATYSGEISKTGTYQSQINNFSKEGEQVALEDQALSFDAAIQTAAGENSVQIQSMSRTATTTNEFFMEQQRTVQVRTGDKNLVNFLYSLGSGGSQMRVRDMVIRPLDGNRYELHADLKIVASYQKKAPTPAPKAAAAKPAVPTSPAASAPAPAAKPDIQKLIGPTTKPSGLTNYTNKLAPPKK